MKRCDLHTHSSFSDGSLSPTELIRLAEQKGLSAVALTDHNTAKGLPEFMDAGRNSPVIPIPGCEFTTEHAGKEIHMVGLFMPESSWTEIEDFAELIRIAKHNSNLKLIDALQKDGYRITYDEASALTEADEFNRSHIARILLQKDYVRSIKEAFETLLKEGNGYYIPAKKINALSAIKFIKSYGGTAVLAHPFLNLTDAELLNFLPQAKFCGLDAMETRYTEFDEKTTKQAISFAEQFNLKQSGGSDFHGSAKPDISLGTGRGKLSIPFSFYESLIPKK